jgi:hypothetical protein
MSKGNSVFSAAILAEESALSEIRGIMSVKSSAKEVSDSNRTTVSELGQRCFQVLLLLCIYITKITQ